ncbi:MAG: hypothetical protein K0Q69_1185 [Devosia sp.]|jgi:hypothetical protein|nr:hypothetical protein [Devosia sp.]
MTYSSEEFELVDAAQNHWFHIPSSGLFIGREGQDLGEFVDELNTPWQPPLDAVKAELRERIDTEAEATRRKYITPGAGQALTYQQKAAEAARLQGDPVPDAAGYPLLAAEIGITAPTLAEVGQVVRAAHEAWMVLGAQIEAARLGAKKAIDLATTIEAACAGAEVMWPA